MITLDAALLRADGTPSPETLVALLNLHAEQSKRYERLRDMYERKHPIRDRLREAGAPNNRLVHDLPRYIVKVASAYLTGKPVQYQSAADDEPLMDTLRETDAQSVDNELAVDAGIYGKGVEIVYADETARPRLAQVSPLNAFVVYDDTVAHNPLLGVSLRDKLDATLRRCGQYVDVLTAREIVHMERKSNELPLEMGRDAHFFGGVPLIEYWNNAEETGDFEPVETLINAYNEVQSDRVNDKRQFTDAFLALYGVNSTEFVEDGAAGDDADETMQQRLKRKKLMYLPGDGAKAEYVVKPDSESGTEVLRQSLKEDIHKLSFVPDLTDEAFAGNQSGVAMRYKLFGLEQLVNEKERWFREGLRWRLRLLCAFLAVKGVAAMDADAVEITFQRNLPVDDLGQAQVASALRGLVSDLTLLSRLDCVDDPDEELKRVEAQKDAEVKRQQQQFDAQGFRGQSEQE